MVEDRLIRQKIVTEIVQQMVLINSQNGFYSEAGTHVFEWLETPLDKDEYPAIIVRDTMDSVDDSHMSLEHKLKIEIDIASKEGNNTTWDMREVSSDVLRAFGMVEESLNFKCSYLGSDFLVEHKDSVYGGVRLEFEVSYQTQRWAQ